MGLTRKEMGRGSAKAGFGVAGASLAGLVLATGLEAAELQGKVAEERASVAIEEILAADQRTSGVPLVSASALESPAFKWGLWAGIAALGGLLFKAWKLLPKAARGAGTLALNTTQASLRFAQDLTEAPVAAVKSASKTAVETVTRAGKKLFRRAMLIIAPLFALPISADLFGPEWTLGFTLGGLALMGALWGAKKTNLALKSALARS